MFSSLTYVKHHLKVFDDNKQILQYFISYYNQFPHIQTNVKGNKLEKYFHRCYKHRLCISFVVLQIIPIKENSW